MEGRCNNDKILKVHFFRFFSIASVFSGGGKKKKRGRQEKDIIEMVPEKRLEIQIVGRNDVTRFCKPPGCLIF